MRHEANGVAEVIEPGKVCIPGDTVLLLWPGSVVSLGDGLKQGPMRRIAAGYVDTVVANVCGALVKRQLPGFPVSYAVESRTAIYYAPHHGDPVVGVISRVNGPNYSVNIGSAHPASLDGLAFDGASKADRPRLQVGDALYCHISRADPDIETEVSCVAVGGQSAKDWSTGENTFGKLVGGILIQLPLEYARRLLSGEAPILGYLGERVGYEICIGLNGTVWICAEGNELLKSLPRTISIAECIKGAIDDDPEQALTRVNSYFAYE